MSTPPVQPEPPPVVFPDAVQQLLDRPREHRAREYQYRFAQTVVFGLPVVGLWAWAPVLDPAGHERWGAILEALLTGWILYVNAGMVIEGMILRRVTGDLVVSVAAMVMFVWSVVCMVGVVMGARFHPILFPGCVILLAGWTGTRWMLMRETGSS